MGIAALVVGIASLAVFIFFGGAFSPIVFPIAIGGIILGALARKDPETRGMGTAGLICSIITLVLTILSYVACVACVGALFGGLNSILR